MMPKELMKIQKNCNHKGHWRTGGQLQAMGEKGKGVLIITTMYCKNCGTLVYASQEMKLPESKITVPGEVKIKN